jgi:hypothetical protein
MASATLRRQQDRRMQDHECESRRTLRREHETDESPRRLAILTIIACRCSRPSAGSKRSAGQGSPSVPCLMPRPAASPGRIQRLNLRTDCLVCRGRQCVSVHGGRPPAMPGFTRTWLPPDKDGGHPWASERCVRRQLCPRSAVGRSWRVKVTTASTGRLPGLRIARRWIFCAPRTCP